MPSQTRACPKCQSRMIEGFTLDHTYGGYAVSSWIEGPAKKSFWMGVALEGRKPLELSTWRCSSCGYLESYAGV